MTARTTSLGQVETCPKVSFASRTAEVGARAVTSQCVERPDAACFRRELLPFLPRRVTGPAPCVNPALFLTAPRLARLMRPQASSGL